MRDAMRPKAHPLISGSPVLKYALRDGWLEPTLPEGSRAGVLKPSRVRLGRVASQVARVQDEHSGAWISVRWAQAKQSKGEVADGYVVYNGAVGAGSTALTRADVRGAEQYVQVPSGGPNELRYTIELGDKIAGLRQVRGTDVLEFVDGQGTPRLRMTAPMALVEKSGKLVDLRLSVVDCAVDRDPRAPWGRAITEPGQRACEVVVSWTGEKTSCDLLVDPFWTTTGSMAQGRERHTASVLKNGRVLVAGGANSAHQYLASAEVYDPSTGTWATTGSMAHTRWEHTASVLKNGGVLVAGGSGDSWLASAEVYDPSTGAWTATGSMAQGRERHTASVLKNGRVLVAGGSGDSWLASAEVYDPNTGTWTTTGSMAQKREYHTASVLQDGRVLVVGGKGSSGTFTSAEVYDPSTGTWTTMGSMALPHYWHTASVLQDGLVLVAGGYGDNGYLASAEAYDPSTGAWTTMGSMAQGRECHTASVLQDGRVLVAGGGIRQQLRQRGGVRPGCARRSLLVSGRMPLRPLC